MKTQCAGGDSFVPYDGVIKGRAGPGQAGLFRHLVAWRELRLLASLLACLLLVVSYNVR